MLVAGLLLAAQASAQAQRNGPSREAPPAPAQRHESASPQKGQPRGAAHGAVKAEFRAALEPHGSWRRHARWGEVWTPADRSRDWRPYTLGRWVYTDDWGWYWISDEAESKWGWVAYHYGRWVFDDELGWCWVPGEEWSPAWVQWRRPRQGFDHVGWAPLPPDEVVVEYVDEPRYWTFVRGTDFIAARLVPLILPVARYTVFIHETVIVNRTVLLAGDGGRFAVNPGFSPAVVAAAARRPVRTFDVRPKVLAGTAPIAGATQVRPQDLGRRNFRARATVRPTQNVVRAVDRVQPAQPLAAGERGRLGDRPPRAARRAADTPSSTGEAPAERRQGQSERQQRQQQAQPPSQQQQQEQPQRRRQQQGEQRQAPPQQVQEPQDSRARKEPTQAQDGVERAKEQPQRERQRPGVRPQRQAPTAQQRPGTEGRGRVEPRQPPPSREVAPPQRQQPAARQPQRSPPQAQRPASAAPKAPVQPGGTEGRSGGGPPPRAAPPPRAPGGSPGGGHGPGGGPGGGRGKPH
jgi:hypothetical protein